MPRISLKDKRVAVTGADGFIGSHLCEALLAAGCKVRALVLYNSFGHYGWLEDVTAQKPKRLEIVLGDIRDPRLVADFVKGQDVVFHLASLIAIPFSYRAPDSYVDTNVKGTLNVLQASLSAGVKRVVHTSTSEVYGSAQQVPMGEHHPLAAQSPYAATKIAADQLALSFHKSFGLPVSVVRPFNTYGPRQSARAIIPTIITQALAGNKKIKLGSLHPIRDFTYVTDIAAGFIAAAKSAGTVGEVVNLGSGEEVRIGDLVDVVGNVMDRKIVVTTDRQRVRPKQSEVDRLLCDARKAERLLKWRTRVSLTEGLSRTVAWLSDPDVQSWYKSDIYNI